jgi:hypothetical protein
VVTVAVVLVLVFAPLILLGETELAHRIAAIDRAAAR